MYSTIEPTVRQEPATLFRRLESLQATGDAPTSERRTMSRQSLSVPVLARPLDEDFQPDGPTFRAVTRDISGGGLGLLHDSPITARYLHLVVELQDEPPVVALGLVRHCTRHNDRFLIGVRFVIDWNSRFDRYNR